MLSYVKSKNFSDDVRKSFGHSFDQMFLECTFGPTNCTEKDFDWFYSYKYGNCFRFNTGRNMFGKEIPLKTINKTGKYSGLILDLYIGKHSDSFPSNNPSNGAHLAINDNFMLPVSQEGFDVAPGSNFVL